MSTAPPKEAQKDAPKTAAPPEERIVNPTNWSGCLACGQNKGIRVKNELTTCGKIACWSFPVGTIITMFTCKAETGRCAACDAILYNKEKKGCFDCC
jgi:hypothetical protein